MNKRFVMERMDEKETKGTFRYGLVTGDTGVMTLYVRKESLAPGQAAPRKIEVNITTVEE